MKIAKYDKKENTLLIRSPSNGLVGTFSISYLIHHLKMKQMGEIEIPELPPTLFVEGGDILVPIRVYNKNNLFVIISDIPFDQYLAKEFALAVNEFCKKNAIKKIVIVIGSMGMSNIKEMFLGSTSNYVIHKSKIPVMVVK